MKDNFSRQAKDYAKYRPDYPAEMIEYIVSFVKQKRAALDVATGNGQVAVALSGYFTSVYATDISRKQLDSAVKANNVYYRLEKAEETGFENHMFNLLTVAQAIHWFDFKAFYKEVNRIVKPGGIIAVIGYGLFYTNEDTQQIIHRFYNDIIGPYWDPERRYLDENYKTIPFPFEEVEVKDFENKFTWTLEQLTGYLETWSAVQHYIEKNGSNPVNIIKEELKESWKSSNKQVTFPLLLRMGKV